MSNIVSVNWLKNHLNDGNLILLDATMSKVTDKNIEAAKAIIPTALYFDIKTSFSDTKAKFPNTIPQKNQFEQEVKALGVNKDSKVVIYDDLGIYSSPRAWWLFKIFGFDNVCILNGGLPEWKKQHGDTVSKYKSSKHVGNFKAHYKSNKVVLISDFPAISINKNTSIIDARTEGLFHCMVPEPRMGLRSGSIPNSINLPFSQLLENGLLKSKLVLQKIFAKHTKNTDLVFTCGSGITACILYLAAQEAGYTSLRLYDGSWTEYGSLIKP